MGKRQNDTTQHNINMGNCSPSANKDKHERRRAAESCDSGSAWTLPTIELPTVDFGTTDGDWGFGGGDSDDGGWFGGDDGGYDSGGGWGFGGGDDGGYDGG